MTISTTDAGHGQRDHPAPGQPDRSLDREAGLAAAAQRHAVRAVLHAGTERPGRGTAFLSAVLPLPYCSRTAVLVDRRPRGHPAGTGRRPGGARLARGSA